MEKISAVYKITNTVTGEYYVGSSVNVMKRWADHKCPSTWKSKPNSPLYLDMKKYGLDKFRFQIIIAIMSECLKQVEQNCIELMKPTYNNYNAKGVDIERYKEYQKKYQRKWSQSEKCKEYMKKYSQSEKVKEIHRKSSKKYYNRLCFYNGETLTLNTLRSRFHKAGIEHPCIEAKKYLIH